MYHNASVKGHWLSYQGEKGLRTSVRTKSARTARTAGRLGRSPEGYDMVRLAAAAWQWVASIVFSCLTLIRLATTVSLAHSRFSGTTDRFASLDAIRIFLTLSHNIPTLCSRPVQRLRYFVSLSLPYQLDSIVFSLSLFSSSSQNSRSRSPLHDEWRWSRRVGRKSGGPVVSLSPPAARYPSSCFHVGRSRASAPRHTRKPAQLPSTQTREAFRTREASCSNRAPRAASKAAPVHWRAPDAVYCPLSHS